MAKIPEPMVVNRAFANAFFPAQNAVGKRMVDGRDGIEQPDNVIIGVVETAKYRSIREQNAPVYYVAMDIRNRSRTVYLYVRTSARTEQISNETRRILQKLGPTLPLLEVATLDQRVGNSLWQERLITLLSGVFAIAALMLGSGRDLWSAGLFDCHARARTGHPYGARRRTLANFAHGLRAHSHCRRHRPGGGTWMAGLLARFAAGLWYAVNAVDVASYAAAIEIVVLGTLSAGIHPTWHLFRIEPLAALRDE